MLIARVVICLPLLLMLVSFSVAHAQMCIPAELGMQRVLGCKPVEGVQARQTIIAGGFQLDIIDDVGYFAETGVGATRLQTVRQVFEDMSWLVNIVGQPKPVASIVFRTVKDNSQQWAGFAQPRYAYDPSQPLDIIDAALQRRIQTKTADLIGPNGGIAPDATITLNTAYNFDEREELCAPDKVSLYGVVLHELLHAMGVASVLGEQCKPWANAKAPFSRWDMCLGWRDSPIIQTNCNATFVANEYEPSVCSSGTMPYIQGPLKRVNININNTNACTGSLSHIDSECAETDDIMQPAIDRGNVVLYPSENDLELLRALGYVFSSSYGVPQSVHRKEVLQGRVRRPTGGSDSLGEIGAGKTRVLPYSTLISNDANTTTLSCVRMHAPAHTATLQVDQQQQQLTLTASSTATGKLLISYIPENEGLKGGRTWCVITIRDSLFGNPEDCPPNEICNGDFETRTRGGEIDSVCNQYTQLKAWKSYSWTPDIIERDSRVDLSRQDWSLYHFPNNSRPDSRNQGSTSYVGIFTNEKFNYDRDSLSEGLQQKIIFVDLGKRYALSCWIQTSDRFERPGILLQLVKDSLCIIDHCNSEVGIFFSEEFILNKQFGWERIQTTFVQISDLIVWAKFLGGSCKSESGYLFIDDIHLIPSTGYWEVSTKLSTPCVGEICAIAVDWEQGEDVVDSITVEVLPGYSDIVEIVRGRTSSLATFDSNGVAHVPAILVRVTEAGSDEKITLKCSSWKNGSAITTEKTVVLRATQASYTLEMSGVKNTASGARVLLKIRNHSATAQPFSAAVITDAPRALLAQDTTTISSSNSTFTISSIRADRVSKYELISGVLRGLQDSVVTVELFFPNLTPPSNTQPASIQIITSEADGCQQQLQTKITEDGVYYTGKEGRVALYPQPAQDILNVHLPLATDLWTSIQITDICGRVVLTYPLQVVTTFETAIVPVNISELVSGTYTLTVVSTTTVLRTTFMVLN